MNIRNLDTYVANLWDWGFLNDCFGGTRIRVTDLDGLVERNGHFLFIEAKSNGKDIPLGQKLLFKALIASPQNRVLIIWGEPNKPQMAQFWGHEPFTADEEKIRDVVKRWFAYANNKRPVVAVSA